MVQAKDAVPALGWSQAGWRDLNNARDCMSGCFSRVLFLVVIVATTNCLRLGTLFRKQVYLAHILGLRASLMTGGITTVGSCAAQNTW